MRQGLKSGVLRTREFILKDSYSFDANEEGLEKTISSMQVHIIRYLKDAA